MRHLASLAPWLLLLGSCAAPPQPPKADPANRHPVNSTEAINLQSCQSELRNNQLIAGESSRRAEIAAVNVERLLAHQRVVDARNAVSCSAAANVVFTILFDFNSARVIVPRDLAEPLIEAASLAPLVVLRGRTDGTVDSLADSRIARSRSHAVRDWLVAEGIPPSRIRTTHQPAGDTAADNATPTGQRLNRRVEIEVYRALPLQASAASITGS